MGGTPRCKVKYLVELLFAASVSPATIRKVNEESRKLRESLGSTSTRDKWDYAWVRSYVERGYFTVDWQDCKLDSTISLTPEGVEKCEEAARFVEKVLYGYRNRRRADH